MGLDVEMKTAEPAAGPSPLIHLKAAIALIEKGVAKKEMRLMARAIRQMLAVRRRLKASTVSSFLNYALPSGSEALSRLLGFVAKVWQQPA
jgi:26S proteasome regulatory subunit N3